MGRSRQGGRIGDPSYRRLSRTDRGVGGLALPSYCAVLNLCHIRVIARDCSGESSTCTNNLRCWSGGGYTVASATISLSSSGVAAEFALALPMKLEMRAMTGGLMR